MQTFYYPMLFFYKSTPLKYISGMFFSAEKCLFDGVLFNFFCHNKKQRLTVCAWQTVSLMVVLVSR